MGPWGCILLDGSYSLRDYSGHLFLWNPVVQEGLGSQGHPAGQRDQGVPSYHSLGGLEHLQHERKNREYIHHVNTSQAVIQAEQRT